MPSVRISVNTLGQTLLVAAPGPTQFIRVRGYQLTVAAAVVVTLQDGNTGLTGPMPLGTHLPHAQLLNVGGGIELTPDCDDEPSYLFNCTPGNPLNINLGAAVQVSGRLWYAIRG